MSYTYPIQIKELCDNIKTHAVIQSVVLKLQSVGSVASWAGFYFQNYTTIFEIVIFAVLNDKSFSILNHKLFQVTTLSIVIFKEKEPISSSFNNNNLRIKNSVILHITA